MTIKCEQLRTAEPLHTQALLDSGAAGIFIDQSFAKLHNLPQIPLRTPILVRNVDGTPNKKGTITHRTTLNMKIYDKIKKTEFLITGLGNQKIILGLPWLQDTNPEIDWKNACLNWQTPIEDELDIEDCLNSTKNPIPNWYPTDSIIIEERTISQLELHVKKMLGKNTTLTRPDRLTTDDLIISFMEGEPTEETKEIWIDTTLTHSQAFAQKFDKKTDETDPTKIVPPEYHPWISVFSEEASSTLPAHKPWDHEIKLKPNFVHESAKVYSLNREQDDVTKQFLDEHLAKGTTEPLTFS